MAKGTAITLEFRGERVTLAALAVRFGIDVKTLYSRHVVYGKPIEEAVAVPVRHRQAGTGKPAAGIPRAVPKLKRHSSGRAYARWKMYGKPHERYFGKWASVEARAAYRLFVRDWSEGKFEAVRATTVTSGRFSVAELAIRWIEHIRVYYVKDGRPTTEVTGCESALRFVVKLRADRAAEEFTPADLRACRDAMIKDGLSRHTCNAYTGRIVRMFGWGAGQSLVSPLVHGALKLVEHLKAGRTEAPDKAKKRPATDAQIAATLPHLSPADPAQREKVGAMIQLQRLTGMRPGEVCALTPADLDTTADVWRYTVGATNKNRHRGKAQVYFFGPRSVAILKPFMADAAADAPLFGITPGQYGHAILRASAKAGSRWTPHQLRHALATEVAEKFRSLEHAAAAIGDSEAVAAAVYVHVDPRERAKIEVARAMG